MSGFIIERLNTPVIAETDVVVLGGGPAGVAAAVAAARLGADVILIERWGHLGGQATGGLVIEFFGAYDGPVFKWGRKIKGGIYDETIDRLKALSAVRRFPDVIIHPEYLKLVYQQMILEAGVTPMTHTIVVGAVVEEERIRSVLVENKSGRGAIKGKVFVDCTGDADTARWCSVPFELLPAEKLKPATLVYRFGNVDIEKAEAFRRSEKRLYATILDMAKEVLGFPLSWHPAMNSNEVWTNEAHIHVDCTVAEELMRAEFYGRERAAAALEFYRKHMPGFENAQWVDTAPQLGTRESRRIKGIHWLTVEDCDSEVLFEDTVVLNPHRRKGPGHVFAIPYRCLVPLSGPKNLLFAGRCISVAHEVLDWMREIPSCACLGQAAGTGAALALDSDCVTGSVDIKRLREKLIENGAVLEPQPGLEDDG
jgi:hypothetical protein